MDFETRIFARLPPRLRHMQKAAEARDTAMAAVRETHARRRHSPLRRLCRVYPVNFNCPGQITVSAAAGADARLPRGGQGRREVMPSTEGARRLPFAFHGRSRDLIRSGSRRREAERPAIPVYANRTAQPCRGPMLSGCSPDRSTIPSSGRTRSAR